MTKIFRPQLLFPRINKLAKSTLNQKVETRRMQETIGILILASLKKTSVECLLQHSNNKINNREIVGMKTALAPLQSNTNNIQGRWK